MSPSFTITMRRIGDSLFAKETGQSMLVEMCSESDRDYYFKDVDLQITFVTGGDGRATELMVLEGGRDARAERLE